MYINFEDKLIMVLFLSVIFLANFIRLFLKRVKYNKSVNILHEEIRIIEPLSKKCDELISIEYKFHK